MLPSTMIMLRPFKHYWQEVPMSMPQTIMLVGYYDFLIMKPIQLFFHPPFYPPPSPLLHNHHPSLFHSLSLSSSSLVFCIFMFFHKILIIPFYKFPFSFSFRNIILLFTLLPSGLLLRTPKY